MGPKTARLFRQVTRRARIASAAARFHLVFLVLCGSYAACLLLSRLVAWPDPDFFDPRTLSGALPLAGLAVAAMIAAAVLARRPTPSHAARLVDRRANSKDVFLTAALIDGAYGEFKPLVLKDAEDRAAHIPPQKVVPFRWLPLARNVVVATAVILAGAFFLPQFDLLGKDEVRKRDDERRKQLAESRQATELRASVLKQSEAKEANSKEVALALEDLKKTFNAMKPKDPAGNLKSLSTDQMKLGELWKQVSEKKLQDSMNQAAAGQRFGTRSLEKQSQWKEQMQKGDTSGIQKEISELQNMSRQMEKLTKQDEKAQLAEEMKKRLEDLADFVERDANSRAAAASVARALDQLGLSGVEGLSPEALEALRDSLNLTELELSSLAKASRDMQSLQDALKTLQMAKRLNDMGALDGAQCSGCKGIGDYEELYKKLMAGQGIAGMEGEEGVGGGMGKKGIGAGGKAPEDDTLENKFVSEQSKSSMVAGKTLLEWKVRGLSDPGAAKIDYQAQVREVKKGIGEAILREQIPPGYHDAIRRYFDSMEESLAKPEKK